MNHPEPLSTFGVFVLFKIKKKKKKKATTLNDSN